MKVPKFFSRMPQAGREAFLAALVGHKNCIGVNPIRNNAMLRTLVNDVARYVVLGTKSKSQVTNRRLKRAGKLPESVRTRYDLSGTCVRGCPQYAY